MYLCILFAYATFSRLNRGYTQPKFAPVLAQTCHGKFTCCLRVVVVLNFFFPCFVSRRPGHSGRKMRNRRLAPVIVGEICPRCPDKVLGLADTLTKFCCAKNILTNRVGSISSIVVFPLLNVVLPVMVPWLNALCAYSQYLTHLEAHALALLLARAT